MPLAPLAPFPRLRDGDTVAVVAPATAPDPGRLAAGMSVLRGLGLEPVAPTGPVEAYPGLPHLAGRDEARAHAVARAWRDETIRAIWCARGGYGVQRMLSHLPAGFFRDGEAKPIIGFSDVTPLLHRAALESGTQMVHGPVVATLGECGPGEITHLRTLLWEGPAPRTLLTRLTAWVEGSARGVLLGGNVALLAASVGTGDLPPARGAIVLLEDIGQEHWVLDRGLTQLLRSGWLTAAAGILLGDFSMVDPPGVVEAVLRDRLLPLGIPVWVTSQIGHGGVNLAVPLGARVRLGDGYLRLE